MNRFKNILAVYNDAVGDDDALAQATALAKRNDARLTVIDRHFPDNLQIGSDRTQFSRSLE